MILLEAPVFSLTKELVCFSAFVVVVIALVILVEIEYRRQKSKQSNIATHENVLEKVEEYRNDFVDDPQAG